MFKIITDDNLHHVREGSQHPSSQSSQFFLSLISITENYLNTWPWWVQSLLEGVWVSLHLQYIILYTFLTYQSHIYLSRFFCSLRTFRVCCWTFREQSFQSSFLARCGLGHGDWQVFWKRKENCVKLINLFHCSSWLIFSSFFRSSNVHKSSTLTCYTSTRF